MQHVYLYLDDECCVLIVAYRGNEAMEGRVGRRSVGRGWGGGGGSKGTGC